MYRYILGLITTQFGARCGGSRLKCHRLASINVCRHLHQKCSPDLDTENGIHLKNIWSGSSNSQMFNEVVWDRFENQNELESADFKKIIFDLVSSYYDCKTGKNPGNTNLSTMDLYQIHAVRRYYDLIPEVGKHLSKSDSFQKLLEMLPNHLENMSIEDQLDIYMGLELLGVPETNLSMNHLFCNFSNSKSMLELCELSKMVAITSHKRSKVLTQIVVLPRFKSLLKSISFHDQEDCKNFSLILKNRNFFYSSSLLIQSYIRMLTYTMHLKDIDFMLKVLNAIFSSFSLIHQEDKKNKFLLKTLKESLHLVEPHIEELTNSQVADFLSEFDNVSLHWFNMYLPKIWKSVCERATKCLEEVLSGDLPCEEKVIYLYRVITFNAVLIQNQQEICDLILQSIPTANIKTLKHLCYILRFQMFTFHRPGIANYRSMLQMLKQQLLKNINLKSSLNKEMNFQDVFEIMNFILKHSSKCNVPNIMLSFSPFLTQLLQSGHACSTDMFLDICKFSVPVLGDCMAVNSKNRIRNFLLSIDIDKRLSGLGRMLSGTSYTNLIHKNTSNFADEIVRLATARLQNEKMDNAKLIKLIQNLHLMPSRNKKPLIIRSLQKVLANKVEYDDDFKETCIDVKLLEFISEKNANKILKENIHEFTSPLDVAATQILAFAYMSRYPKEKRRLEKNSRDVFDKHFDSIPLNQCCKYLLYLCYLGIYLDEYLQRVFNVSSLAKLDENVDKKSNLYKQLDLILFAKLNREVVLHRKELNIPWISGHIVETADMQVDKELVLDGNVDLAEIKKYLVHLLGGTTFFQSNVIAKYGVPVDFEFYLNSANEPMVYEEAKIMDHTKADIQKVALNISREATNEFLAENVHDLSVNNCNMTKDLRALGYRAVLIQEHDWNLTKPEERCSFLKKMVFY